MNWQLAYGADARRLSFEADYVQRDRRAYFFSLSFRSRREAPHKEACIWHSQLLPDARITLHRPA